MPTTPTLSLLVPTYRYARYLPEALESVLAQDFRDMEILLVDDASGDGSDALLSHFSRRDPRIHAVVHPANLGMVPNWNWCLDRARGRLVRFLFGDDLLTSPDALSRHVRMLDEHPGAVMATSARALVDPQSHRVGRWDELRAAGLHNGRRVGRDCLLRMHNLVGEPSAVTFRRDALLGGGFDGRYRQLVDLELWLRLLRRGDLVHTPDALCGFRRHPEQATARNARLHLGFTEHAMLLNTYGADFLPEGSPLDERERRDLYVVLHYARKAAGEPSSREVVRRLGPLIEPGRRLRYAFSYRALRPWVNLRLSLAKRLGRPRREWSFSEGWRTAA